jgi:glycosyltransferase involved in cell wall biosynthesis/O-antigen/teichoic acid export membrane protein
MTSTTDTAEVGGRLVSGSRWLTASTVVVGVTNYLFALVLTRVLTVGDYEAFAAGQALLLVVGTVASSSVPWVVAKWLAGAGEDRGRRRQVVWFALLANVSQGLLAGVVTGLITTGFAGPATAVAVGGSAATIFLASTVIGWLLGRERFREIAAFRVGEVTVKAGVGFLLALAGAGVVGAISGFAVGALVVLVLGLILMRHDIRPTSGLLRAGTMWRNAGAVVAIQGLVAVLASLDHVLIALLPTEAAAGASYQVAMILARAPLFVAGAIAMAVFPLLSRDDADFSGLVRLSVRVYVGAVGPAVVVLATVPDLLVDAMFPPEYDQIGQLLSYTAITGSALGLVGLLATFFQGAEAYVPSIRAQIRGLLVYLACVLVGFAAGGVLGFAVGSVAGGTGAAWIIAGAARARWADALRVPPTTFAWVAALGLVLVAVRDVPLLWTLIAVPTAGVSALLAMRHRRPATNPAERRLRILHLGFEDHKRPGSGGGALRTHEVNRRLAREHDVTVLTTSWPGCEDRVDDGVQYVHIGRSWGYSGSIFTYFLALPVAVWRHRHDVDLVVEDFAAPISSALSPLWSPRPVVAMVQWLNAREKSSQYKLPFFLVEMLGLRLHRHFIAVSEDLAATIRRRAPHAEVWVVPNGVDLEELPYVPEPSGDIVYLGRIEFAQKGIDLLIDAFARVAAAIPSNLKVAGAGPDEPALRRMVAERGLNDRVELVGPVHGEEKSRLLSSASLVAMPSRFETFGIVAIEAQAAGTPVIAFDIPCLREVVPSASGVLVPPFDVDWFARELIRLLAEPASVATMGRAGQRFASRYDWDAIALEQETAYREVLEVHAVGDAGR